MHTEPEQDTWGIAKTDNGFGYWLSRPNIQEEVRSELSKADLLIVPQEGFREHAGPVFPVGTEEFLQYLRDNAPPEVTVDICADDTGYQVLALHSALLILGGLVVKKVVLPAAAALITGYIKKRLDAKKDRVRVAITVTDGPPGQERAATLSFEGPVAHFEPTIGKMIQELRRGNYPQGEPIDVPLLADSSSIQK